MTLNNFTKALTSHQSRRPFVQYDIELSSGSILRVKHPDALAFLGKRAVVITPDGLTRMFDDESVTQITETQEPAEKSAKDGPAIKETS